MSRDTIQLEDVVSTISQEHLIEFTSEYGIPEDLHPELPEMDLFGLIHNPNPFKVKTGTRPRAAHEVPLLTSTASRVIGVGAGDQAQDGLAHEVPSVETATTTEVVQEPVLEKEVAAMGPPVNKSPPRELDNAEAKAPP
ncbi:hypothetical protein Tco_0849447 [Tanacetum coccineum]